VVLMLAPYSMTCFFSGKPNGECLQQYSVMDRNSSSEQNPVENPRLSCTQ